MEVLSEYRLFVLYKKYRTVAYFSTLKTYNYVMDASHSGCRLRIIEYRSNNNEYINARCRQRLSSFLSPAMHLIRRNEWTNLLSSSSSSSSSSLSPPPSFSSYPPPPSSSFSPSCIARRPVCRPCFHQYYWTSYREINICNASGIF